MVNYWYWWVTENFGVMSNTMTIYVKLAISLLLIATFTVAQETKDDSKDSGTFLKKLPVRLGSDGRPLLFAPNIEMCQTRKLHIRRISVKLNIQISLRYEVTDAWLKYFEHFR